MTTTTNLASKQQSRLRPTAAASARPLPTTTIPPPVPMPPSADNEVACSTGPIYEDIDRMCSYRGYPPLPPDLQQKSPQPVAASSSAGLNGSNDDYYNLSGGSSPRNKSSNRYVICMKYLCDTSPKVKWSRCIYY